MARCHRCGEDNPARARFCLVCGSALESHPATQERKVVTVLFCDLVGFTATAERLDPEDVQSLLTAYQATARHEIERFGGSVERFVGDGVLAVFGIPKAHEDDPERAVRSALALIDELSSLELSVDVEPAVRIGVNSGEVLVNLGVDPRHGDVITGDVVNTAARLEALAAPNSVVVGATTHHATHGVIDYQALEPVSVKGKAEPLSVWTALSAKSRFGVDLVRAPSTPFIGRTSELDRLTATFRTAVDGSSIELVTIVGEPGVGKSRLVSELFSFVDQLEQLIFFRQGRSLPYGDGITFWGLGEIVKAHAGILESDNPDDAATKLRSAVAGVIDRGSERDWFVARLAPLVGAATSAAGGGVEKEESFTAWRRFLEAIAARSPLVVLFEDLHWADDALLDFIEHLAASSAPVPLLVVCTARPELFDKHPDWGGGPRAGPTLALAPLDDADTSKLIAGHLGHAVLPAEIHAALLERAGGNPLYAEEFIRMLSDRGLLKPTGRVLSIDPAADIPMPATVQSLIAARLDTLAPDNKALLLDAAVVGKVFWAGAVAALGGRDRATVAARLDELVNHEFVRAARVSSIAHDHEYSFSHALIRDVCYHQTPRRTRAHRHRAMATWLEQVAGDRVSDHAEVLAHHYVTALELTRAARDHEQSTELEEPTRRFLMMAAERARALDQAQAEAFSRKALELTPSTGFHLPELLMLHAYILQDRGANEEACEAAQQALDAYRQSGDRLGEGEALVGLYVMEWHAGRIEESKQHLAQATRVLEAQPPSPQLARASAYAADDRYWLGEPLEALLLADRALATAESLDDASLLSLILSIRGQARCEIGDRGGLGDLQDSVRAADACGEGLRICGSYEAYADWLWLLEGTAKGLEMQRSLIRLLERRRMTGPAMQARGVAVPMLVDAGSWDDVVAESKDLSAAVAAGEAFAVTTPQVLAPRALVLLHRGLQAQAASLVPEFLEDARRIGDLFVYVPSLATAALIHATGGDREPALACTKEFAEVTDTRPNWRARCLIEVTQALQSVGELEIAEALQVNEDQVTTTRDSSSLMTARAMLVEAHGDDLAALPLYEEAASRWERFGNPFELARAQLGVGRTKLALGELAADALEIAHDIFATLAASPWIAETKRLKGRSQAIG